MSINSMYTLGWFDKFSVVSANLPAVCHQKWMHFYQIKPQPGLQVKILISVTLKLGSITYWENSKIICKWSHYKIRGCITADDIKGMLLHSLENTLVCRPKQIYTSWSITISSLHIQYRDVFCLALLGTEAGHVSLALSKKATFVGK